VGIAAVAGKHTVGMMGLITEESMMVEGGAKKGSLHSDRSDRSESAWIDDVERNSNKSPILRLASRNMELVAWRGGKARGRGNTLA